MDRETADKEIAPGDIIARALRDPPLAPLPDDLAAEIVAAVERNQRADRLEAWLQGIMMMLLAAAGMAMTVLYRQEWLGEMAAALPTHMSRPATQWLAAVTLCVAISLMLERRRR